MSAATAHDLAPLNERLWILQGFRVVAAVAVLVVPELTGDMPAGLVPLAAAYVGLTVGVEILRLVLRERWLTLMSWMLLLDGAFLALATTITGGARSPLLFLMFFDVLAVTLLASYRSGIKIAIWSALLLFAGHAAVRAGAITSTEPTDDLEAALGATAFLAVAVAAAACSALNERALRNSRAQLASIVELDAELARAATARTVATALARSATVRLGFARAAAVVRHDDGWVYAIAAATKGSGEAGSVIDVGMCGPPRITESGGGQPDPQLLRTLDPDGLLTTLLPDAECVVLAPVAVDGEALGVVAAEWRDGRARIPALTVESLARAASHAALSLRHQALLAEVQRLATHDPLTGLANRRVFEETLERELNRAARTDQPLTLLVVDVDHFKKVNDTHGHPAGDGVLRAVAAALASNTKGFDLVVRFGGDEFAVVVPGCGPADAGELADRLRGAVSREINPPGESVSIGWSVFPAHADDPVGLLAAADDGLYAAKRAGRARAQPGPAPARISAAGSVGQADDSTSDSASARRRR
jgi:diguanylate cyclase (GGDEF)-like protein